jgi:hypothetical protein
VEDLSFMMTVVERALAFLRGGGIWWGLGISAVLFAGSIALVTAVVIGWSADHFKHAGVVPFWAHRHPVVRGAGRVGKNLAGVVLVALGIVLALPGVPGQGLLTILIGLTLIDFPGKRGLERRLIGRPHILRAINRVRARFQRPALELD